MMDREHKAAPFYNERRFSYCAGAEDQGITVGQFLKKKGYSRQAVNLMKQTEGGLLCNGQEVYVNVRLRGGDLVETFLKEEVPQGIEPVKLPFPVVYEDEDLMVVDKPADMPVHPSMKNYGNTLANAAAWYGASQGEPFVYRCINRLDRDTTGLLILARNMLSSAVLNGQMRRRQIHRTYLAVVTGMVSQAGTVRLPIGRKPGSAIERAVDPEHGEPAVTHYRPLRRGAGWTLVECVLETGRTHQIRVHMSALGHPLAGDFLYGTREGGMPRQALHSWKLSFLHPVTGREMEFTSPIPEDMEHFMKERL